MRGVDEAGLASAVIGTDRRYFELAAERVPLGGATLLHLPGSAGVGAGTVVWVDDHDVIDADSAWLERAAHAAAARGAPVLRVYGLGAAGAATAACRAGGLTARHERIFVGTGPPVDDVTLDVARARERERVTVELRPASGADGRTARRRVAAGADTAPDGHPVDAERFLSGEERRANTGELELFVAWADDGEPVAVVGALRLGPVLRLKNLLVRPDRRRLGIARAVTAAMLGWAADEGSTLAALALAGEPGEGIYPALGMVDVGADVEWSRPLDVGATDRIEPSVAVR